MELIFATKNRHKLMEAQSILRAVSGKNITLILPSDLGYTEEIEEDGNSFEENARIKAQAIFSVLRRPTIADDSGLCVDALYGAPGIYSARFAGEHGNDAANIEKLLKELETEEDRRAQFVCAAAFISERSSFCVRGDVVGEILFAPRGEGGFGYDPVFYYPPFDKSFAEFSTDEKNKISHRHAAFLQLSERLKEEFV